MSWVAAYPFATASSAAFYTLLVAYTVPRFRGTFTPLFTHPVPPTQEMLGGFDSLRGIAAAMVALAHCWWATHPVFHSTQLAAPWIAYATKWVSIFAVLSGFLIYRSGLKAIQESGDASRLWHPKTIPHLSGVCAWRSALPCTRAIQRKCQHQPSILLLL